MAFGAVIVAVAELIHPEASVTATVYTPAVSPVAVAPDPPLGVHA